MITRKFFSLPALFLAAVLASPAADTGPIQESSRLEAEGRVFPGAEWTRIENPESAGFSRTKLAALRGWLQAMDTSALAVVVGGRMVFEYGDLSHLSYLASVRKSILAVLYGKYVETGVIPLDRTLKDIGFTEVGVLLDSELEATIEHLITARSGIYHPASNSGDDTYAAPPRGSQRPGTYHLYNNWDFNAAGAVFEMLTGKDVYDALAEDLAGPLGMQDYDAARQRKSGDLKRSKHPAYHIWLSTRDMARLGLLMLRQGEWDGRQVVPREWAARITSLVTPLHEMNPPIRRSLGGGNRWAYGYMWWVWDAPNSDGPFEGAYAGMGAYGQYITVLPKFDMVVVHKTDPEEPSPSGDGKRPRSVSFREYDAVLRMLIAAALPR